MKASGWQIASRAAREEESEREHKLISAQVVLQNMDSKIFFSLTSSLLLQCFMLSIAFPSLSRSRVRVNPLPTSRRLLLLLTLAARVREHTSRADGTVCLLLTLSVTRLLSLSLFLS